MSTQAAFLSEIDAFLARQQMAETTFGRKAVNDGKFVERLRRGGGCTGRTMDRVRAFMAAVDQSPLGGAGEGEVCPSSKAAPAADAAE